MSKDDYKETKEFMNLYEGKYADLWKGFSNTDIMPNIEKLVLFTRAIKK